MFSIEQSMTTSGVVLIALLFSLKWVNRVVVFAYQSIIERNATFGQTTHDALVELLLRAPSGSG